MPSSRASSRVSPISRSDDSLISGPATPTASTDKKGKIMELFDGPHTMCEGNPQTAAGKRMQLIKMMSIILVPLTALLGLTGYIFGVQLTNYIRSATVRNTVKFSIELGEVIRNLQTERDMSALYLSSIRPETKAFLVETYPETDKTIERLTHWPVSRDSARPEFQSKEKLQLFLNRHRYELDTAKTTVRGEINLYSTLISELVEWLYNAIAESRSGDIWRQLVSYIEIITAKENFGIERALGAIYYTNGHFDSHDDYLLFVESQDVANATFESAREYSEIADELYRKKIREEYVFVQVIRNMRHEARRNVLTNRTGSFVAGTYWFQNITLYLDQLHEIQEALADYILRKIDSRQYDDFSHILLIGCVFGGVVVMCPVLLNAVYALTSDIQNYSITIAEKKKQLRKETRRTDMLLYEILPVEVMQNMKSNTETKPELFSEVTIFFSDVIGFTKISAESSPIQVVIMLNNLYGLLDDRITTYDVYKVETIGDAYMVASGVPRRNGRKHAGEIATLGLDVIDTVHNAEILHLPGKKFKLRIGIHTGPVVAGVVGNKLPRYCLFGNTVNIASRMEALGLGGKVHISEATYYALCDIGGFSMARRTENFRNRHGAANHGFADTGEVSMNTYWLVDKTGMKRDPLYVADAAEGSVTSYAYSDSLGSLGGLEDYADAAPYEPMDGHGHHDATEMDDFQ